MVTLIDCEFTVNVSRERAWRYLARLDQWPMWAHHIKHIDARWRGQVSVDPKTLNVRERRGSTLTSQAI